MHRRQTNNISRPFYALVPPAVHTQAEPAPQGTPSPETPSAALAKPPAAAEGAAEAAAAGVDGAGVKLSKVRTR